MDRTTFVNLDPGLPTDHQLVKRIREYGVVRLSRDAGMKNHAGLSSFIRFKGGLSAERYRAVLEALEKGEQHVG